MKKAINKNGFSFVEIISQCPVSFGKIVGKQKASDFLRLYKESSVPVNKASSLKKEELKDKIVIGEFVDQEREEFTEVLRRINKEVQKLSKHHKPSH